MREHLSFLKISSAVVKISAWFFLSLGIIGGISILCGLSPDYPRWMGIVILILYAFFCFLFYFIAKMADVLGEIIKEIKKA